MIFRKFSKNIIFWSIYSFFFLFVQGSCKQLQKLVILNTFVLLWFFLLKPEKMNPVRFGSFLTPRRLCVWSKRFLSAFMAHKGKEASIGIECLFLVGGGGDGEEASLIFVMHAVSVKILGDVK